VLDSGDVPEGAQPDHEELIMSGDLDEKDDL